MRTMELTAGGCSQRRTGEVETVSLGSQGVYWHRGAVLGGIKHTSPYYECENSGQLHRIQIKLGSNVYVLLRFSDCGTV